MQHIVIIGSGFSGLAVASQLAAKMQKTARISLINPVDTLLTGMAYQRHNQHLSLNVNTARMSFYPDQPEHFLDWVMQHHQYARLPRQLVASAFLPRALYGDYLQSRWHNLLETTPQRIAICQVTQQVVSCQRLQDGWNIILDNNEMLAADILVLANGNHLPSNRVLPDAAFADSPYYIQNPWHPAACSALPNDKPAFIIGNGLSMVDTVLSLRQQGFRQPIIAVSPNGYNILPHRHPGLVYPDFSEELLAAGSLRQLVKVVRQHIQSVRQLGISAEPVIDAIRPYTQQLWRKLSAADKKRFMARIRHMWGVARHRVPLHIADKLQQLRLEGLLQVYAGRLLQVQQLADSVQIRFMDKKTGLTTHVNVGRVFNCTGPETDIQALPQHFLYQMLQQGLIRQDPLKLGIATDINSLAVLDGNHQPYADLYTLGSNLKGELWESTAVNELRTQATRLAASIIRQLS